MRKGSVTRLVLGALAAVTVVLLLAATASAQTERTGQLLSADLNGAQEAPGPGDPDGTGKALIRIRPQAGQVCFILHWENIATPTAAHIHVAPRGHPGPVVVTLFSGTPTHHDCVEGLDPHLLRAIKRHPSAYYVNVHNADFPDGAIRGQLERSD